MRRAATILILAAACSKPQPAADTSAVAPTPTVTPAPAGDTAKPFAGTTKAGDPVQPQAQAGPIPGGSTAEVVQGTVGEHGADPLTFIAITSRGAQTRVSGAQLAGLSAVKGAEVWARGRREGNSFVVDSFEVRRANNQAVADGIVSVSGTTVSVRTSSATLRYPDAPTALRNAAGARVWITPPVAGQAPSFGVIRARQ